MTKFTESEVEEAALEILSELGYKIIHGPDIAPDGISPERKSYSDVILIERLIDAIDRFNPNIPEEARDEVVKKVFRSESPLLIINNQSFHKMLVNDVDVEYRRKDGSIAGDKVWLFDFKNPQNNEFLAVNQFTILENNNNRRPDIILFINGLPLVVIELKNPADENATIWSAFNQLETYKAQIPSLFPYNEISVISDGIEARAGTITSNKERFMPWKTIEGKETAPSAMPQLEVLFQGMFNKKILLDLIRHFIVFEQERQDIHKKLAAYHQYHAVNKAIEATLNASSPRGDKRCGVVWHTQGSGKSLTMAFYTGKLVLSLDNPTIVVLTDRNDLDDQLFGTFSRCHELLRQKPVQAASRSELKELLMVASGGVVFTTIQKFFPEEKEDKYPLLSERRNIIVIADELKKALSDYTESGGRGKTVFDKEEAVALMLEKYEHVAELFHGFDYEIFFTAPPREKMSIIPAAMEHVIKQENGKDRYLEYVTRLSQAFALAVPHEEALKIRDEVGFFQVIRSGLAKTTVIAGKPQEELDSAIRQIISRAIVSDKVIDIFDAVGLKKPDISILSDEFLAEVKRMPHKNLAFELLRKLLNDEIKTRSKKNLIQGKSFAEMLEKAIKKYQNKSIETAQIIEELIELAKDMREARLRGEKLNLNEEELAFYDALEVNDSAVKVLGDEKLTIIARELVDTVRKNVTIDWTLKESVQAKLRVMVKRILKKYGYPPDKQKKATETVLEQAKLICKDMAGM